MSERSPVLPNDDQLAAFEEDGVVHVPGAVDAAFVDEVLALADRQLAEPGPWVTDTGAEAVAGRLFTSRYLWRDDPVVRRFAFESGVAGLAAACLGSTTVRLYFDHLLVKEPGTASPTPWHQDIPYWPFRGRSICSVWVACTSSTVADSSLEFVRGSHRWDRYFAPKSFDGEPGWTDDFEGEEVPDVEADRDAYDIVGFDVEPGDAIVFSAWAVHGSRGNDGSGRRVALSTRWLGDDAVWHPHPGCDPTVTQDDTVAVPGEYPADDDRFPTGWPTPARAPGGTSPSVRPVPDG
ncbi:MAG: phytanoyl-CoA dioxygenase [Acidimicrobiaceae bacterium]|nr:phytanoyl-CoA dioxygenase [Acidimicrobiaceae bacterium]